MSKSGSFLVDDKIFEIEGLSEADPYLKSIAGRFERKFQDFCRTFLDDNSVALDIGANIGATALILSHYLRRGAVFALEPGKRLFELLQSNLKRNAADNVIAYPYAISDKSQQLRFIEYSAYGHIDVRPSDTKDLSKDDTITAYSLDDLVDKLKLDWLDFIKVDIEGFEPQFFKGAKETLARFNPIIYFELNSWCLIAHGKNDPLEFMRDIVDSFRFVYRVNKDENSAIILEQIESHDAARTLVHDNIVYHGSVDDIVVSNAPEKINVGTIALAVQCDSLRRELARASEERDTALLACDALRRDLDRVSAERDTLQRDLDRVSTERDTLQRDLNRVWAEREALRCDLDAVLASRSWRYSGIFRALRRLLG